MMATTTRSTMPISGESPAPSQKIRQVWTPEEDSLLSEAVARETQKNGPVSWHKVASHLPRRNNKDCRKRWHYSIANTIRKGTWMREEDEKLREAVEVYGARWSKIAEAVGSRNGDQCWKRWYDCLDPRIDKSPWTAEEDARLLHLVSQTGRNWSDIVHQHFPNRTSLAAKNRYSILRRKQEGGASSRSSSVRHAKSGGRGHNHNNNNNNNNNLSSTSTPSLSSSPYLSVPTTPSTTGLSTPEPEFCPSSLEGGKDWMALTEAEIDELLYQSSHLAVADGWHMGGGSSSVSATPSPQMGCRGDLDRLGWTDQTAAAAAAWATTTTTTQAQGGFDSALVDPRIQTAAGGFGGGEVAGGYYHQQQQQQLEAQRFGYENMLGVYQGEVQVQGMYGDGSAGFVGQGGMGSWQGGYATGSW